MNTAHRSRRRWILGGTALSALAAGAGWQAWRGMATPPPPSGSSLWTERFPTPEGGELALSKLRGRPLVLNFWATWCPPCIKELPALDRFHREWSGRGWQVVGLAVDNTAAVQAFLQRQPLGFPVGMAGLEGTSLSRQLGNEQGALPFTAVFDREGRQVQRKLGQTSFEELARWAQNL